MGDDYRCVVRQAVLAVAGAVPGRRTAWFQNVGADAAGEIVAREAAADLWGNVGAGEDTGGFERDLDLGIVHVGRYRGGSPHLGVVSLFSVLDRIRIGRHLLAFSRTPDSFRVRDDDGLWSRIVPHTVFVSGEFSALWVTRGTRPTSGRPSLVVVSPPRPDTPTKPARRVVRREK